MTVLEVETLTKGFGGHRSLFGRSEEAIYALKGVSLTIERGQSFGLVGESGSGKSTLARCVIGLERPTGGTIRFKGEALGASETRTMALRSQMQIVFQDPYASLNPRMRIETLLEEPLVIHADRLRMNRAQRRDRAVHLLESVGLASDHLQRFPHEFSGGQRQRIAIARALAVEPELLILDEPTSALDVSVQAQVLDLLLELRSRMNLTYLFVSHDLGAIRYACDRVGVLCNGEMVEQGETASVFDAPQSDYTRALLAAVPDIDPDRSLAAREAQAAGSSA